MAANQRRRGSLPEHEDESSPCSIAQEMNRMPLELSHLIEKTPCFADVRGRVALVTGGGTGIGRGIARRLASEGMHIAICGRRAERLAETADLIQQAGGKVLAVPCDVSDAAAIDDLCERTLGEFGRVDALIHNAMAMHFPAFEEMTLERWDQTFATAPRAAFLLCQRLIPGMAERGHGGIVFVSSVLAQRPNRNGLAYVAAKGALEAMGRQLATAFADAGIRVNTLAPGRIASRREISEDSLPNELIPVGRAGTPAEMAAIVAFLLSHQSSYITGQVIHADGGTSVQLVPPGVHL
jgi:NAD(P)-dependent dehydrogenase (short-subunit alcohol dehydrogenase family)